MQGKRQLPSVTRRRGRLPQSRCRGARLAACVVVFAAAVGSPGGGARAAEPIKPIPEDIGANVEKAALGRALFHDPRISRDDTVSCASCHVLSAGGDDGRKVSVGIEGQPGLINSPTVFNTGLNFKQFWDGRAGSNGGQQYRTSIGLVRQIQQLSSSWSIEIARVRADPLADFDSLAAFIPRMARLKEGLSDAARRIPDLPDRLASDVRGYLSAIDAKEERIERFKTGYAVVRNSSRFLPLAATNVARQAQEIDDAPLARSISMLTQDMNLYLATPTDTGKERLTADMEKLREDSVAYPPPLANALANMLAHAEVLLARQAPTDLLFQEATSNEITDLANRLAGNLEFELAGEESLATHYERGVLAVIGVLALFWILLAVQQRARGGVSASVSKRLGDVPEIFASKTEIRLLLAQILENSVCAVEGLEERKGSIKIDTAQRNEEILITIIDNGAGITPDRRKQIFKPFYTSRDGAMGLGLTLAGHLVKKYEGGIKVNSLPG